MIVRKVLTVAVILLFIGMSVIPSTGTVVEKKSAMLTNYDGNTLYVGGDGPGNYTTIGEAIDDADNGDTVFVYNGIYYEHLKVKKSINLIGENKVTTIVDGSSYGYVIDITADNVSVEGFTITNSGSGVNTGGIIIFYSDNNIIKNNIMSSNNDEGISLFGSNYNIVINNRIINNVGMGLYGSGDNNIFASNNVSQNGRDGMRFKGINNSILNNTISSNSHYGVLFDGNPTRFNIIARNHIVNNGGPGIYFGGFGIWFGNNNTIRENVIESNSIGIKSFETKDNHIYYNNLIDNNLSVLDEGNNIWDNGYPSGGNYWSNFDEPIEGAYDEYRGENQDQIGEDGIVDKGLPTGGLNPYNVSDNNKDWYPLIKPINFEDVPEISDINLITSEPLDTDIPFGWENISCTVVDDDGISEVKFAIVWPGCTMTAIMINIPGTDIYYFNTTFPRANYYNYYITANDTYGNRETSSLMQF